MRFLFMMAMVCLGLTGCQTFRHDYVENKELAKSLMTSDPAEVRRRFGDMGAVTGKTWHAEVQGRDIVRRLDWELPGLVIIQKYKICEISTGECYSPFSRRYQYNHELNKIEYFVIRQTEPVKRRDVVGSFTVLSDGKVVRDSSNFSETYSYDQDKGLFLSDGVIYKPITQSQEQAIYDKHQEYRLAKKQEKRHEPSLAEMVYVGVNAFDQAYDENMAQRRENEAFIANLKADAARQEEANRQVIEATERQRQEQMRAAQAQQSRQVQAASDLSAANQRAARQAEAARQKETAAAQAAKHASERQARSDQQNREAKANAQSKMQAFVASTQNTSSKTSPSPKANEKQDNRPEARAWCRQSKRGKFTCWGPLQKLGFYEDTLQAALKLVDCDAGVGYTPPPGGSGESFRCIGRKVEPYDEKIPAYDPYAGENS